MTNLVMAEQIFDTGICKPSLDYLQMKNLLSILKSMRYPWVFTSLWLLACSTPVSDFRIFKQSDGTIGVHAPKSATDAEAYEVAETECQKLGKRNVTLVDSRKTTNDRFPFSYTYLCR